MRLIPRVLVRSAFCLVHTHTRHSVILTARRRRSRRFRCEFVSGVADVCCSGAGIHHFLSGGRHLGARVGTRSRRKPDCPSLRPSLTFKTISVRPISQISFTLRWNFRCGACRNQWALRYKRWCRDATCSIQSPQQAVVSGLGGTLHPH